ncbi:MAG: HDOD domain-containing protein [Phycisphaerae bacterium]
MTTSSETDFVRRIEALPPLPAIAHTILAVTSSPDASAHQVAQALRQDPSVASRILRVANSPFYGASQEITQISRAVVMLGARAIRNLVLGICARSALIPSAAQSPMHGVLWRHSVATATACDLIARSTRRMPPEEAFLAGLLHDAGKLAMVGYDADFISAVADKRLPEAACRDAERDRFGIDHAEAGCQILARWGLPESLCRVAGDHHAEAFEPSDKGALLLAITMLADDVAHIAGHAPDTPAGSERRLGDLVAYSGLSESDVITLFSELNARAEDAFDALGARCVQRCSPTLQGLSRIQWITCDGASGRSLSMEYLTSIGCDIHRVNGPGLCVDLPTEDAIFIEQADDDPSTAVELASKLTGGGCRKVVLLGEPGDDEVCRRRDATSGAGVVPRVFTVFDISWLERQWQA